MTASFKKSHLLTIAVLIALLLVNSVFCYRSVIQLKDATPRVTHTIEVLRTLAGLFSDLRIAQSIQHEFLITQEESVLAHYVVAESSLKDSINRLKQLTKDNERQYLRIMAIDKFITVRFEELNEGIKSGAKDPEAAALYARNGGDDVMTALQQQIGGIQQEEELFLNKRAQRSRDTFRLAAETTGILCMLSFMLLIVLYKSDYKRQILEIDRENMANERSQLLASEKLARMAAEKALVINDDFMATVSHELRTPLNAILGWATLLKKIPNQVERGLVIIERNARAQAGLIDDLLDMNLIASGKLEMGQQDISLGTVIDYAIEAAQLEADEKKITLTSIQRDFRGIVHGDPVRLQQVLNNLIGNVLKLIPENGTITVILTNTEQQAVIAISYSGEGIEPEFFPKIFGHFEQGEAELSPRKRGLNLRLAISKSIIESHGGRFQVENSGKGHGSILKIFLPLYFKNNSVQSGQDNQDLPVSIAGINNEFSSVLIREIGLAPV